MTDDDYPPFGQYRASGNSPKNLGAISANYFHYLWHGGLKDELKEDTPKGALARYIEAHIPVFQKENDNLIWNV